MVAATAVQQTKQMRRQRMQQRCKAQRMMQKQKAERQKGQGEEPARGRQSDRRGRPRQARKAGTAKSGNAAPEQMLQVVEAAVHQSSQGQDVCRGAWSSSSCTNRSNASLLICCWVWRL